MYSLDNAKFNVSCINMVTMVHVNIISNQNKVNQKPDAGKKTDWYSVQILTEFTALVKGKPKIQIVTTYYI